MRWLVVLLAGSVLGINACSQGSYIEGYHPKRLVLRKDITGGFLDLTGTELNVPGFSLYADGTVVYYGYQRGKRVLYSGRLEKSVFEAAIERVESSDFCSFASLVDEKLIPGLDTLKGVPESRFFVDNGISACSVSVKGLGLFADAHPAELISISAFCDTLRPQKAKPYRPARIRLFVKRMNESEPAAIPNWSVPQVPLDTLYRVAVGSYLLNDERNSVVVLGSNAKRIMKLIEVPSIYEKFSFKGFSYRVGYRPFLPDENE